MSKRFFLNLKELSDANVASLTKNEYGSAVYFLWILMKSLLLIADEWFSANCWSFLLFEIFVIKKWVDNLVVFSFIYIWIIIKTDHLYVTLWLQYDFIIKRRSCVIFNKKVPHFVILLPHRIHVLVPCGYVLTLSNVCNLLSSSLLSAILFISFVYTSWWSLLNLCCDFSMILSLNRQSL